MDFIQRRKDNRLCLACGKPLDREGVHCISCNKKRNEDLVKTQQTYKECGICPRCRKNPIMSNEGRCPECRAKYAAWQENIPEDKKQKRKEQIKESHERKRQWCRDNGICYNCKKRKVIDGKKLCGICRDKLNKYNRERRNKNITTLSREQKIEKGICIWCDNPARKGKKLCDYHCDNLIKNLEKYRVPNEYWRKANSQLYRKKK